MSQAPPPDESGLIAAAREGDESALAALCKRYEAKLRARVERRLSPALRRRVAASDVIQEALMVAAERIGDFEDRGPGSFGRWLGRIVDLKAQQLVRHHAGTAKRDVGAEVTRAARATMGAVRGRSPSPSQIAIGKETREAAQRAIAALPPTYQQVIRLIQGEGLTLAQAGERMGRTRDAVKGLYSRALGRLARELNIEKDGS